MRTINKNIVYLKDVLHQVTIDTGAVESAIKATGTYKEINAFFDKKAIAFGKWLLGRDERTLEHSVEELMEMYNDYLAGAPDDEQID